MRWSVGGAEQLKMVDTMDTQQLFRYRHFHIDKSQQLGHGSYGAVYKAKCDQLTCAAKVLHPTILDPGDRGADKIMQRFQQECSFLAHIRHPNIVQYLGMTIDPEPGSRLPVLLMELLDESLTSMLEAAPGKSLAYYVQVNICHDVALAVAYLHSNGIIHRDLSSNNVLILAKSRAKVTDFGMSTLASSAPTLLSLTMCPGTPAYMSPEALEEQPRYTEKLDCFSEGVIMIQVCTRLWPKPGLRTKSVPFPASPTGMIQMPVLEQERRKNHIDMIDRNHGLLPIAMDCLQYQEDKRPSSDELCQRLAGLKETAEYRDSIEGEQNVVTVLKRQIEEMQVREAATFQQLSEDIQQLRSENQQQKNQVLESEQQVRESQRRLQQLEEQLRSKERKVRSLNQHLEEQEQITAEIQHSNHSLQSQVEQLQRQLSQQSQLNTRKGHAQVKGKHFWPWQTLPSTSLHIQDQHRFTAEQRMLGNWGEMKGAKEIFDMSLKDPAEEWTSRPVGLARGATVVDGKKAYFMNYGGQTYCYDSFTRLWNKLPDCPSQFSSLAVVRGLLTAIGGRLNSRLLSIFVKGRESVWEEHFPPMPTKRYNTAAVSTMRHLIVAGGMSSHLLTTVEVMDTRYTSWSTVADLPFPYTWASAIICEDHIYMLGGLDRSGQSKSVLTCSLTKLLRSSKSVWNKVADIPVCHSTCAAVNGDLLAVGGEYTTGATTAVHKYNQNTNSWDIVSNMPTARHHCLVAVLPTKQMIVVGGCHNSSGDITDKIEVMDVI